MRSILLLAILMWASICFAGEPTVLKYDDAYSYTYAESKRPWGTDINVTLTDLKGKAISTRQIIDRKGDAAKAVQAVIPKMIDAYLEPPPKPIELIDKTEVERILIEKKYLTEGQTLADLPIKTEVPK